MLLYLAPKLSFSALHRNYPKEFDFAMHRLFQKTPKWVMKRGLYLGMEFQPFRKWTLKAYVDYYQFPWLKFGVDAPSSGKDYLCHLEYYPSKKWNMYLRWKWEDKQNNEGDEFGLNDLVWNKNNPGVGKCNTAWEISNSRTEWSGVNTMGRMVICCCKMCATNHWKVSGWGRN